MSSIKHSSQREQGEQHRKSGSTVHNARPPCLFYPHVHSHQKLHKCQKHQAPFLMMTINERQREADYDAFGVNKWLKIGLYLAKFLN